MGNWVRHLRRRRFIKTRQLPSVIAILAIVAWSALSVVNAFGSSKAGVDISPQYEYSTTITTSTSTSTSTTTTTTPTNTKPGKGCGDKNHLHERRFECKVVISGTSAKEGNSGTKSFVFTVALSGWAESPVTVNFATADGSAHAGDDYVATSGTLTFIKGQSVGYVSVQVNGNRTPEPDETFYVNLSNPSPNAYLGISQAPGTILNDD